MYLFKRLLFAAANECHGLCHDQIERSLRDWLTMLCDEKNDHGTSKSDADMSRRCERLSGTIEEIQKFIERFQAQSATLILSGYPNIDEILRFFAVQHTHCWGILQQLKSENYKGFCDTVELAQYTLGKLYLSDDPEVHDIDDGLRWLERATQNGNTDAAYHLGKEYLTGKSVQKNVVKAAEYLRHAADQNHPWANYLLGKLHLTGNGVPKDEEAAWNCFRMANTFGHPYARYILERQEQWQRPELLLTVSRLLYHMSNIFRDNAPAPPAQPRLHIDRKRMQELQELRIALGHQPDDHEEEQTQTQTWGGMTMKGW